MNGSATVLRWQADPARACGNRLQAIAAEAVQLAARVVGELDQLMTGQTWRGPGASRASSTVQRHVSVVRVMAAAVLVAADCVLDTGRRILPLQAALDTALERAHREPLLDAGPDDHLSLRPWAAVGLLPVAGAGGFELARLELLARHLSHDIAHALGEAQRIDHACAATLERLEDTARSLVRTNEPALLRADHELLLGDPGLMDWLRAVPPPGSQPQDVADWWAAHLPAERAELLELRTREDPSLATRLGALDGLPLDLRDALNRAALDRRLAAYPREIADLEGALSTADGRPAALLVRRLATAAAAHAVDLTVRGQLSGLDAARDVVSGDRLRCLLLVDEPTAWGDTGRVSVSVGPADTAAHVAYVVPGFGAQPGPDLADLVTSARDVYDQARTSAPGTSVAVIAWLGYQTPGWAQVAFDSRARAGAALLARDLEGLRAARSQSSPHLTLIGHSYGSTTVSLALRDTAVQVDDAVFLGSPGLLAERASDLPVRGGHVWVGAASGDEISHLSRFGVDPAARSFGAHRFPAECPAGTPLVAQHTRYLDAHTPSLRTVAAIVVGLDNHLPTAPGRVDSGLLGELERLAAIQVGLPIVPELLGSTPGDPTFGDPAR